MRRQQILTADHTQVKRYAHYSLDAIRFAAHYLNEIKATAAAYEEVFAKEVANQ